MRYRSTSSRHAKSTRLGQYFTPAGLAMSVARSLRKAPDSLLELGAGDGALIRAVLNRFPMASITAVEVDAALVPALQEIGGDTRIVRADVLDSRLINAALGDEQYSSAIGNPPYGEHPAHRVNRDLRCRFPEVNRGGWIRRDVVFLWESWQRIRPGGELAIIIASSLVCDSAFSALRSELASNACRIDVYALEDGAFPGVEVRTFLLVARKRASGLRVQGVRLHRASKDGHKQATIALSQGDVGAEAGWDHRYHELIACIGQQAKGAPTLSDLGAHIVRGSQTHAQFREAGMSHVHTCNFSGGTTRMRLNPSREVSDHNMAVAGDVLVPRVGTRCLLRQATVVSGYSPHTEAVFRIRVPRCHRKAVLETLESPLGLMWREKNARGSCAKYLTVESLMTMPIPRG